MTTRQPPPRWGLDTGRIFRALVLLTLVVISSACQADAPREQIVVYSSVDQNVSEPILAAFEAETGIDVLPVFDLEAAKTTGLVNRIKAEGDAPQADVWWNGEFSQTIGLAESGYLEAYRSPAAEDIPDAYRDASGLWTGFGGRARVILVNTDRLPQDQWPSSIEDFLDPLRDPTEMGIAYPVFGTSASQAAALYALYGPAKGRIFYEALAARGPRVVDGNSVVRDLVAEGQLAWGLTDTDDACAALARGAPVEIVFPDQGPDQIGTLIIPNTVALIRGGPNPEPARRFVDWLLRPETEARLIEDGWIQLGLHAQSEAQACVDGSALHGMAPSLDEVAAQIEAAKADMAEIFVR